jgi:hypothetical protein
MLCHAAEVLVVKTFSHQSAVVFKSRRLNMLLNRKTWNIFEEAKDSLVCELKKHPDTLTDDNLWKLELMTPQERGPMMEKRHILLNSSFIQKVNASRDKGDFYNGSDVYYEYKFSVMGDKQKCNFVQIRLHQNVDYVLEVYDTQEDRLMKFFVPHDAMSEMVSKFGGLAHGTLKNNANQHKEYALRPSRKGKGKAAQSWNALQEFQVNDKMLEGIYSGK